MGRAIDMENRIDDHERRLKLVEDALDGLIKTSVHHVDLHESTKEIIETPKKAKKVKKETASA